MGKTTPFWYYFFQAERIRWLIIRHQHLAIYRTAHQFRWKIENHFHRAVKLKPQSSFSDYAKKNWLGFK